MAKYALQYLEKAAQQGDAEAQFMLGNIYTEGDGVEKNVEQAMEWFGKAAAQGNEQAKVALDKINQEMESGLKAREQTAQSPNTKNGQPAVRMNADKAENKENEQASVCLNVQEQDNSNFKTERHPKKSPLKKIAILLSAIAALCLIGGFVYYIYEENYSPRAYEKKGDDYRMKDDYQHAIECYKEAFYAYEKEKLGVTEEPYLEVIQDYAANVAWKLGEMEEKQDGDPEYWYSTAASTFGYEYAERLGDKYYGGKGLRQSYLMAKKWYEEAAALGEATAQLKLGTMYEEGKGIRQDYQKAEEWYEKAATQGNRDAEVKLGWLHPDEDWYEYWREACSPEDYLAYCNREQVVQVLLNINISEEYYRAQCRRYRGLKKLNNK